MTHAAAERSGNRRTLALLTSSASLGDTYQGSLRWGVEQACNRHDVDLLVYVGRTNWTVSGDQHKLYYLVDPSRVDGIIFATGVFACYAPLNDVVATIKERCPVPICSVGQHCPGVLNILVDNEAGASQLVGHLVQYHGYRHFACITGPAGHHESEQRLAGTRESLARFGLGISPEAVVRGDFSVSAGSDAVCQLLEQGTKLEVIVCANDDMAIGALDAVKAAGLRCPDDVVITGFDDAASARFCTPPLTTVRQPATRIGSMAVDHIMRILNGEVFPENITLPTELVVRESCGCRLSDILSETLEESTGRAPMDPPANEISHLLRPQFDDDDLRDQWIHALIAAVLDEKEGREGRFHRTLDAMLSELPFHSVPLYELQRVITLLCRWAETLEMPRSFERTIRIARSLVGSHVYRRAGERQLRNDALVDELRISWERFATALSLSVLKSNLVIELPRLGIQNGAISLFETGSHRTLMPWVCLRDGASVELSFASYPSTLVFPEVFLGSSGRRSCTVLPLTFETELFGIAVLELPVGLDAYALLREQISSALRAVQKHEDFVAKERLRVKIEEEHRQANDRLHSLGVIAGGVAHDLNNVLGPMVALPDTIEFDLRRITAVPHAVFEDLELIRQASHRAAQTIGDLFLLGRTRDTPRTYLSINHLLSKEAAEFRAPQGRPEITVEISVEGPDLVIQGSKPHIVRAISNLILNAAKAIEDRGRIQVAARRVTIEKTLAGHTPIPRGEYVVVEVRDDGCGIPSEHIARIMEPFFTVSHSPGQAGFGLGLAIVRRIVSESQGYIHVQSAPGEGSTFSLYFPLADRQVTPSIPPADITGGFERLLVVDDEMVQLRASQRMLQHLGYTVTTVQSGEAAIGLIEGRGALAPFDLIIIDMLMPGLDGIETVERIRRSWPGQRAIIASGYAPERMSVQAAERGMAWLAKPYTLPVLAKAVRDALTSGPK